MGDEEGEGRGECEGSGEELGVSESSYEATSDRTQIDSEILTSK